MSAPTIVIIMISRCSHLKLQGIHRTVTACLTKLRTLGPSVAPPGSSACGA